MNFTLKELSAITGGELTLPEGSDPALTVGGITAGLYAIKENDLYCCPMTDRLQAQRAMLTAWLRDAAAVLSEIPPYSNRLPHIRVKNYEAAMNALACAWRERLPATVIAVTGSCGKTTTKELLYAMLRRTASCTASPESSNALGSIPLNLLAVRESDRFAVLEAGIDRTGDMEQISAIVQPDIGIVTNIGAAHLEGLGSVENVLAEKLKLFDHAAPGFAAFLNGEDPLLRTVTEIRGVKPHFFHASDWRGELPFAGEHFRTDVAAAAAVARFLGVPETEIEAAVRDFTPPEERCQFVTVSNCTVVNDCYNANPSSMRSALELLSSCPGRRIAVLGDMLELGENAPEYHRQIGVFAAEKKPDALICIGVLAENIALGALEARYPKTRCAVYPTVDAFLAEACPFPTGSTVLLKASHAMGFERILRRLQT